MDFPKSVPGVGLVAGRFVDEDPLAATPGSLIPSDWGNAITLEILNLIESAGLDPDEADLTQLTQAVRRIGQSSSWDYAQDTGAANVYTAAYAPAVTSLSDGAVFRFKAKTANTGASTFSPNGLLAKPIVGLGHAALQGGEIVAGGMCGVVWSVALDQWVLFRSGGGALQVPNALKAQQAVAAGQLQEQALTAFTTAGAAPALTLTPSPAIGAYSAGQRFRVKFSQASTGADTLNISGRGAKSVKQYDSTGAKVSAIFAVGQLTDVEYDGVDFVVLDALPISVALDTIRLNVPTASTINLTTAAPNTRDINITGAGIINGFTVAAGMRYFARFAAAGTLTNSASLVTQSGANITTAAGDTCIIRATADNVVEILCYTPGIPQELGYRQAWQNVTASRAVSTTYTNTTGRPIMVAIGFVSVSDVKITLSVDGLPVLGSTSTGYAGDDYASVSMVVPNNSTYSVTTSAGTLTWLELR